MSEKSNNNISIYAAAVPSKQKKRLLAAYCEYISLVRTLEGVVSHHTVTGLASHQSKLLFPGEETNPWIADVPNSAEKQAYENFIKDKKAGDSKYCFVSLNLSTPEDMKQGIVAAPEGYGVYVQNNTLPNRVERFVAAFPKEALLKDTRFIIDGKYTLDYADAPTDVTVAATLEDELVRQRFQCMLEIVSSLPENLKDVSDKELRTVQRETLASALTAPFENAILSALATLTEESGRTIQKMLGLKKDSTYLHKAESSGIIPSASRFQDYQNIRHLMRHQRDSLDNLGRFTFYDADKNISVRARFLAGYGHICGHPLSERVKAYTAVGADFATLVTGLSPELLIRGHAESNNKFLGRLKAYRTANPETALLVETAYSDSLDKKRALIKNIEKFFPDAEIIDRREMNMDLFIERMTQHVLRERFLDIFADIEYKICQYSLFSGKNQPALICWQDLAHWKVISADEAEKWGEYRSLRNELSHRHMDADVVQQLETNLVPFAYAAMELEKRLAQKMPQVFLVNGNIYRAVHADGKTVEIDFKDKRVLSVTDASGNNIRKPEQQNPHRRGSQYTEEYANHISITISGTEIIAFRMQNGTEINLNAQKIIYPNYATFYFNSAEHNCLICKGGVKLLTDKSFRVINYICKGKSVRVSKKEVLILPNSNRIAIGPDNCLETESWQDSSVPEEKITYEGRGNPPFMRFSDGTTIKFKPDGAVVSHAGIELTYQTRQAFAGSYSDIPPKALSPIKNNKGR